LRIDASKAGVAVERRFVRRRRLVNRRVLRLVDDVR
jgi:hypothetical protein